MKEKILSVVVILLLILNGFCIHCVNRTVFTWVDFLNYSFIFSIPFLALFTYIGIKSGQHKDKPLLQNIATGCALGYVAYVLCLSCIPFGINYYFSTDEEGKEYATSDFEVYEETTKRKGSSTKTVTYEYEWMHDGASFDFSQSDYEQKNEIIYTVHEGLLGFDVVKTWKLE